MNVSIKKHDRLAGVEIRHLAALEAIARTGSFRRAGAELGYSQPAISQQIAALERAAGMQLLRRPGGRRPVIPTDAGERLLRHAHRATSAMRAAEADLHSLAEGEAGMLRVGTFQSAGVRLLPGAMRSYVERWPNVEVRLVEAGYDEELHDLLERGDLDLAFVLENDDPTFERVHILTDPYVLLAPSGSAVAATSRPARPREIAALPLIVYRRADEGVEAFLHSRGLEPEIVFRSDEGGIVQGLVGAGIGYAVVPLLGVDRAADISVVEVAGIPPREITIAWHADRVPTAAAQAFVEIVAEIGAEIASGYAQDMGHPGSIGETTLMKVLTVVGNRPQFIKSAPLSTALRDAGIVEIVVHTGQHWDPGLSAVFFDELGLDPPRVSLDLRTSDIATIEAALRVTVSKHPSDVTLVYGDTNSTLAGARASSGTAVAHVEAGLRSGDLTMPEERNRLEVDRLAAVLFAPDERSATILRTEAVDGEIHVVGDVMADAAERFAPLARERSKILGSLGVEPGAYVLATVHREANVRPTRLRRIITGLAGAGCRVVLPAHPRTRAVLREHAIDVPPSISIVEPLGYLDFAALASQAAVIATDSGGLQKEAYWYGVPCVTMRPSTEWIDTVTAGANVLVDDDPAQIAAAITAAELPAHLPELYGDGHASERIAAVLRGRIARCAP